jgi:hypothetical protein
MDDPFDSLPRVEMFAVTEARGVEDVKLEVWTDEDGLHVKFLEQVMFAEGAGLCFQPRGRSSA